MIVERERERVEGIKFDQKKLNDDEIIKKNKLKMILNQINNNKKIKFKFKSLKNHGGVKLKNICGLIDYL